MLPVLKYYDANGTDGHDLSLVTAVYEDANGNEIRQPANLPPPSALPPSANQRVLALLDIVNQVRAQVSMSSMALADLDTLAAQKPADE